MTDDLRRQAEEAGRAVARAILIDSDDDEPTNDYGRGFVAGYHAGREAGKQAGRASRDFEVRNLRARIHELEQDIQAIRLELHRAEAYTLTPVRPSVTADGGPFCG